MYVHYDLDLMADTIYFGVHCKMSQRKLLLLHTTTTIKKNKSRLFFLSQAFGMIFNRCLLGLCRLCFIYTCNMNWTKKKRQPICLLVCWNEFLSTLIFGTLQTNCHLLMFFWFRNTEKRFVLILRSFTKLFSGVFCENWIFNEPALCKRKNNNQ